eukprot:3048967-Ditylum_brightwellii.AAC.1
MGFELNQCVFACRGSGRGWHQAIIKVVINGGELYMVSWSYHTKWDDMVLPPNYLRVVQKFNVSNQVQAQRGKSNAWFQAIILHCYNHGACYLVLWLHQNIQNKVVRAAHAIGNGHSKGCLRSYCDGFGMGHDMDFGAGEPR